MELTPTLDEWEEALKSINPNILKQYEKLNCLKTKEIKLTRVQFFLIKIFIGRRKIKSI